MGKRLPHTPSSQIRSALRRLWMRSRERSTALKRDKYTCQQCGVKQSKAIGRAQYVEVHHKRNIQNWDAAIDAIRGCILAPPEDLETLCPRCHDSRHGGNEKDGL